MTPPSWAGARVSWVEAARSGAGEADRAAGPVTAALIGGTAPEPTWLSTLGRVCRTNRSRTLSNLRDLLTAV
ncbi:hypothetical protein GCM10012279_33260 [Micromonospora yangpuensis]|nr:hypothetical protein GCM10012279_33260 [Micromonospora yangpuensis]